jgi:competence protein ComEC
VTLPPTPSAVKDFRLAIGAVAAWMATAVALGHSPSWALGASIIAGLLGVFALAASCRGGALGAAIGLAAFCAVMVLAPLSARLEHASTGRLGALARARTEVVADLTITSDPRLLTAKGAAGSPRAAVDATLTGAAVAGKPTPVSGKVLILCSAGAWTDVLPGQRVRLDATLQPPLGNGLLQAVAVARGDPELIGEPPWWQRAAGTVRESLRRASASLPREPAGLLPGLIDGDTRDLDPVLSERFRIAGLTHLVAVSGTNCAIVVGAVLLLLRRSRAGPRTSAVLGLVVLVAFVILARPSPSVLRAAFMAAIMLFGLASGRERDVLPALAATVLALLIWQPELAIDNGFTMSVLATAALLLIAPGWAAALRRRHVPSGIAEPLAVAAAAHVVTAPVIADISGRVSLVAIPANLLAEPVVAAATILGFLAALVAPFSLTGGSALAQLAGIPCRWLIAVADYFGGLHGATIPWPSGQLGGFTLLAVSLMLMRVAARAGPRRMLAVAAVVVVVVQIPVRAAVSGWPVTGWILVACDVGQGDGLVLQSGPHSAVVIDAGPDPVAMSRCLDDLGITDVPMLLFSHYHLDHVGGIVGVFRGRTVHQVLTGPLALPVSGVELVANTLRSHRLAITPAPIGSLVTVGAVQLDFLAPKAPFRGTRSDPNNSSLVIRATVHGRSILLSGDAEIEAQQSLLESGVDVRADVLKVPHHGSAYSDPAFLAAVHAQIGIISVGANNDYGLPSPLLVAELARLGLPTRRTDQDGDVAVVDTDGRLSVVSRGVRASSPG